MTNLLVILAHGHAGKPGRSQYDLGAVHGGHTERDLVPWYMAAMERVLSAAGATVRVIRSGSLDGRQEQALSWGREWLQERPQGLVLYLPCHMDANAGSGPRSLVLHDQRSRLGARLAHHVRLELAEVPDLGPSLVFGAHAGNWTVRAFNTHRFIWDGPRSMCAATLEPLLVTGQHDHLLGPDASGLVLVGEACARGVLAMAAETLEPEEV